MTIRELIEKLNQFDGDLPVYIDTPHDIYRLNGDFELIEDEETYLVISAVAVE